MLDRAETLLHDHYGGKEYWDVSVSGRQPSAPGGKTRRATALAAPLVPTKSPSAAVGSQGPTASAPPPQGQGWGQGVRPGGLELELWPPPQL